MNAFTFENLRPGDIIQRGEDKTKWLIIADTGGDFVTAQRVICIGKGRAGNWSLLSKGSRGETSCSADTAPPAPEPLQCPPDYIMTRELFDAGYVRVEHKTGYRWQSPSKVDFATLETAWINLKSPGAGVAFVSPADANTTRLGRLQKARTELIKAGWRRREDSVNGVCWVSPDGACISGSLRAHAALLGGIR